MTARACFFFLILPLLPSCSTLQRLAKAGPAKPTPFLAHADEMKTTPAKQAPFLKDWRNPSEKVWKKAEEKKTLYIAPVTVEHLRPMTKPLSRLEIREQSRQKKAAELAEYMRAQFIEAFRKSTSPRYQIVEEPQKDAMTLELAIVEMNPNSVTAGVTRRTINLLAVPGAESLFGRPLKGNIAIEGRLSDPQQKKNLYEFSDSEHNRSALILSVHDYNHYSYARKIIREWAAQFEEMTRTPEGGRVKDSPAFTIWLW